MSDKSIDDAKKILDDSILEEIAAQIKTTHTTTPPHILLTNKLILENVISWTSGDFEPKSDLIDCEAALVSPGRIRHGNIDGCTSAALPSCWTLNIRLESSQISSNSLRLRRKILSGWRDKWMTRTMTINRKVVKRNVTRGEKAELTSPPIQPS